MYVIIQQRISPKFYIIPSCILHAYGCYYQVLILSVEDRLYILAL